MDEYLTTKQIAKLLQIKGITVRRWISSEKLPAVYLGKEYRVTKSDFEKFIEKRKVRK